MPKKKLDIAEEPKKPKKRRRTSVVVGHREDGTPVKRYPSASSGTKLAKKVDELKRVHGAGGPGEMADIMFEDYAEKFLEGIAGEVSLGTLRTYTGYVRVHIIPFFGKKQVRSILQSDGKVFLARLAKTVSQSTGELLTINARCAILSCLKQIMNMAQDDNIRVDNPIKRLNITPDVEPKRRALTDVEKAAALKYIADHLGTDEGKMVAMNYYTSCRRGEVFGPQWKHFDFKNRKIKICQQLKQKLGTSGEISPKLKTKRSYRDVPMHQELFDVFFPLRGHPEAYVFQIAGRHYSCNDVNKLWSKIMDECPALSELTPHYFRHNYATEMYKNDIPAKEAARIMGETIKVMLERYVHISEEMALATDNKIYGMFSRVAKSLPSDKSENHVGGIE